MSVPTINRWVDILEATGLILRVLPFYENLGKRLIKSPKIYWADSGLACFLLGIQTEAELERSPFLGAIFEGMVAAEIAKSQINQGLRRELYYVRDQQGLEVDFIMPAAGGGYALVEAKATRSPTSEMAKPMQSLARAWAGAAHKQPLQRATLVHRVARAGVASTAIAPGVEAVAFDAFVARVNARR